MSDKNHKIQIFNGQKVRTVWNADEEKWYFSIVDVCWVLAESKDYQTARKYWKVLKHRLIKEGNETVTNQAVRERFSLEKNKSSVASRIIAETVERGFLKVSDEQNTSTKYVSYIPFYG